MLTSQPCEVQAEQNNQNRYFACSTMQYLKVVEYVFMRFLSLTVVVYGVCLGHSQWELST